MTDLGFALVDGLQTLTREHVDLFRGEVGTQQTAELQFLFILFGGGGFLLLISACKEDNKNRAIEIKSKIKERFLRIYLHMSEKSSTFAAEKVLNTP